MVAHDQKRFNTHLQMIAAIITILAAAVSGVIWTVDHLTNEPASTGQSETPRAQNPVGQGRGSGSSTQNPAPGAAVTPSTGADKKTFLDSLTPDTGTTNLGPLPRALSGQPGYEHAVTVPCG